MENAIIVGILIIVGFIAIRSTVKHFQGKSGCCGGGSYKPRKKKLSCVITQKTFRVEGMHCEKCKARVEEIVNDIKGVAGKADLKKGELTVSYSEEVSDELIKARIERAGYTVTEIWNADSAR